MSNALLNTVGQLVAERPARARLFEKLGIDYCCGGKKSLADACKAKGLDGATVAVMLDAIEDGPSSAAFDVSNMTLSELADHIEKTHHAYLKTELPRLTPLIQKIAAKHSDKNAKLPQLPPVFLALRSEMESHMAKEERILFPMIRQIESGQEGVGAHCGGIQNPIRMMEMEHQSAGDALARIREITDDFSTPPDACKTYRGVMHALRELEADMHQHVHKENNVLFPGAARAASGTVLSR